VNEVNATRGRMHGMKSAHLLRIIKKLQRYAPFQQKPPEIFLLYSTSI